MKLWPNIALALIVGLLGYMIGSNRRGSVGAQISGAERITPSQSFEMSTRASGSRQSMWPSDRSVSGIEGRHQDYRKALATIASYSGLGLHDLRSIDVDPEQIEELKNIRREGLAQLKKLEARNSRPIILDSGEAGVEIEPFPEEYDSWISSIEAAVDEVLDGSNVLVVTGIIESELGHRPTFGHMRRQIWTTLQEGSTDAYVLHTVYLDSEDGTESKRQQTFSGMAAPPRYDHLFTGGN